VALFVLILVGLVVAQTWLDWRDSSRAWIIPDWAKGMALGGVIAVSLAAATSFASVWIRDETGQWTGNFGSRLFFIEMGFLLSMMGVIIFAARKHWLRMTLLLGCMLVAALFLGLAL
jgi:hypothetical protein